MGGFEEGGGWDAPTPPNFGNANLVAGTLTLVGASGPYVPSANLPPGGIGGLHYDGGTHHTDARFKYGVLNDGFGALGSIGTGTAVLTISSPFLTSTAIDGGKLVKIAGAGAAGADLLTTISTVTDSTHATLAANAATTVTTLPCVIGTDNTVKLNTALADIVNWQDLFMGTGLILVNGKLTLPLDQFARGKRWSGGGRTNQQYPSGSVRLKFDGTYIMQLADNINFVETSTTITSIENFTLFGMTFGFFTPQSGGVLQGNGWQWAGVNNSTFYHWNFINVGFDHAYVGFGLKQDGNSYTQWNNHYDLLFQFIQHRAIDFTGIGGCPVSYIDFLGIFNTNNPQGRPAVVSDDTAVVWSQSELEVQAFDIEGWYNGIWTTASQAQAMHFRGVHIEHHTINVNTGTYLFNLGGQAIFEDINVTLTTTAGLPGKNGWLFRVLQHGDLSIKKLYVNLTLNTTATVALATATAQAPQFIEMDTFFDNNLGGANALVVPDHPTNGMTNSGPVTRYRPGWGLTQTPVFNAAPTPDPTLGESYQMAALTGAVNVGNPINFAWGQRLRMYWKQDGTGTRVVTYTGANWRSVGIAAQSTAASTVTIDEAECVDGVIWRVTRLVTGQTV